MFLLSSLSRRDITMFSAACRRNAHGSSLVKPSSVIALAAWLGLPSSGDLHVCFRLFSASLGARVSFLPLLQYSPRFLLACQIFICHRSFTAGSGSLSLRHDGHLIPFLCLVAALAPRCSWLPLYALCSVDIARYSVCCRVKTPSLCCVWVVCECGVGIHGGLAF